MSKYQLMIQHADQKVAYVEFNAENDKQAVEQAERIFSTYKKEKVFAPSFGNGMSGNFTGYKPAIQYHDVSKWVYSAIAQNAWGRASGGYWETIK